MIQLTVVVISGVAVVLEITVPHTWNTPVGVSVAAGTEFLANVPVVSVAVSQGSIFGSGIKFWSETLGVIS